MSRFISVRTTDTARVTINVSHIVYARENKFNTFVVLSAKSEHQLNNTLNIAMNYSEFVNMVKAEDYE